MANFETITCISSSLMSRSRNRRPRKLQKSASVETPWSLIWESRSGVDVFQVYFFGILVLPKYWEISFLASWGRKQWCRLFHLSAI